MALTPTYAWPTPELSEPANVPVDTAELANAIEGTIRTLDPAVAGGAVPVGVLAMWPTADSPIGWLLCDGRQVDASIYPKLALVLAPVGGMITLPDLTGRVAIGVGVASGDGSATAKALGTKGGKEKVALSAAELAVHTHTVQAVPSHAHSGSTQDEVGNMDHQHGFSGWRTPVGAPGTFGYVAVAFGTGYAAALMNTNPQGTNEIGSTGGIVGGTMSHFHNFGTDPAGGHTPVVNNTGGDTAHENLPPYLAINYIIRAG